MKKFILHINTGKNFTLSHIFHKITKSIKNIFRLYSYTKIKKTPRYNQKLNYIIKELDMSEEYLKRFNSYEILDNIFTFLNRKIKIDTVNSWNAPEIPMHWLYNLHYFEYVYSLASSYKINNDNIFYKKYKSLTEDWIDNNPFNKGVGWTPYVISIRLINWISGFNLFYDEIKEDTEFEQKLVNSIYTQYKYLFDNTENDTSGYRYFENIRALIAGAIFFGHYERLKKLSNELNAIIKMQILRDGLHFELSPMYHNMMLEGLIKIKYWLDNTGKDIKEELLPYIKKMLDCSYSLEIDMGRLPLFNDCAVNVAKSLDSLMHTAEKYWAIKPSPKTKFKYGGYYIYQQENKKMIIDSGKLSPPNLAHHEHCDALSYELAIDGQPFIVNSGTYQYEEGKWRDFFRSTSSHNTLLINNTEQFQYWGSFKAAKRLARSEGDFLTMPNGQKVFKGHYFNYKNDFQRRCILWVTDDVLLVLDRVITKKNTNIKNYIHLHPNYQIKRGRYWDVYKDGEIIAEIQPIFSEFQNLFFGDEENGWYAPEFGIKVRNYVLEIHGKSEKPYNGYIIDFGKNELNIKKDSEIILLEYGKKIRIIDLKYIGL